MDFGGPFISLSLSSAGAKPTSKLRMAKFSMPMVMRELPLAPKEDMMVRDVPWITLHVVLDAALAAVS